MVKWNNTDIPLAYLITFRTYGTWLPGDPRGSIDRFHNIYRGKRAEPNEIRRDQAIKKLKSPPVILNAEQRKAVSDAILEVCEYRSWKLFAKNVRTNHVHGVISAAANANRVLNDLKAYATRKLNDRNLWNMPHSPWVDKGSKRMLWTEEHIYHACDYVLNGQGDDLPEFG